MRMAGNPDSNREQNETGPYLPADLVLIPYQPPYAVNRWHTIAALPRNPLPPRGCRCSCFGCTTFCQSYIRFASYAPVEDGTDHDHITGCQLNPRWTTVPVQESQIGYAGPSALVCWTVEIVSPEQVVHIFYFIQVAIGKLSMSSILYL